MWIAMVLLPGRGSSQWQQKIPWVRILVMTYANDISFLISDKDFDCILHANDKNPVNPLGTVNLPIGFKIV